MSEDVSERAVAIVATGVGNTASVVAAFTRLGCATRLVSEPGEVESAGYLVLPGVGAFAAAMEKLNSAGLVELLRQRILDQRPTLSICLGLQLLGVGSEEDPNCQGIGCAPVQSSKFEAGLRVPHMGWNQVRAASDCELLGSGEAYFAHSYLWRECPDGWSPAMTTHGEEFVSAVERGAVLACQFHPELSGAYGAGLLTRWLETEVSPC